MSSVKACYGLEVTINDWDGVEGKGYEDWEAKDFVEALMCDLIKTEFINAVKFIDTSMFKVVHEWSTTVVIYFNYLVYDPHIVTLENHLKSLDYVYNTYRKETEVNGTAR